jgi:shikimate dehydrogenase
MHEISGKTRVVGVFGWPIEHSLSPAMHNAAFAALGLSWVYVPFPVPPDGLQKALAALPALGIVGVNLTIPHKERAIEYMHELTPIAEAIGAINTVHCLPEGLLGDNTDGEGFFRPLQERHYDVGGKAALLVGAGGAARAVAYTLVQKGIKKLTIANRTPERAEQLAEWVHARCPLSCEVEAISLDCRSRLRAVMKEAQLLVNSTSVGMYPYHEAEPPIPPEWLQANCLVYDLVYNPMETRLLQAARARGCATIDGVQMLVWQGAAAFERWVGQSPPVATMEAAVRGKLQGA